MKSVIITGATRGIGLALARFYADKGYCLMLNGGHNEEALAAVEKELSTKNILLGRLYALTVDGFDFELPQVRELCFC